MSPTAHRPAIVFCGFMAAGKSGAAREAARVLGVEPIDADALIELELGEPIASFFEREGEAEFRRREEALVLGLLDRLPGPGGSPGPAVIALGGGAVESDAVREVLAEHVCVWCRVDLETAWERASRHEHRPLASDWDAFSERFAARAPLYESVSRAILPAAARDAAGPAAPWLAALEGAPEVKLAWAVAGTRSYPAAVGPGAIGLYDAARAITPGAFPARAFCVADSEALRHHAGLLPEHELTIEVAGSERSKSVTEAERVLTELARAGVRRDDAVLAFGGGVVGDLAGFCAATYQRGVPVVQLPTTLVAQIDSAYGGKTGVDLPEAKNYVGAYHQPLAVLADPATLETLPPKELAAGFVELLKTALIAGGPFWERVRGIDPRTGRIAHQVIFDAALAKIEIVAEDERDSGRRAVLNLGHTVGHAIEAATGYGRYRHGEAVGLGLLATLRISGADELRSEVSAVLERHRLPTSLDSAVAVDDVIEAIGRDKKRTSEGVGFVLLERPGEPRWGERVADAKVREAVEELQRYE